MIDPILFRIQLGNFSLAIHWYGIIVVTAVIIAAWLASLEVKRHGENPEKIWDMLPWLLLVGVVGARLWYVMNATIGGSTYYVENPAAIINIPEGGLHIFGGFIFGGLAFIIYAYLNKLNMLVWLDSIAPYLLIGQAIARPANFINQELYGPPTTLPWGIPIDAAHRLPQWSDLTQFPLETTRFHPTFAYEMVWNFAAAGLLIWLSRRYEKKLQSGTLFFGWLVLAGIGRAIIETWRPDQPVIAGLGISISRLVALMMALLGVAFIFWRYKPLDSSEK